MFKFNKKVMFKFNKKKEKQFIYLTPAENDMVKWELLDEKELETRVAENSLEEGSRLFRVDQEIKIRFEKVTHLE